MSIKIGFIGFGLIGGSIALCLRKNHPDAILTAFRYNKNKPNKDLEQAVAEGVLNKISTDLMADYSDCDLIFLCAPISTNISYLKKLKPIIKASCLITDVGSVKGSIQKAASSLDMEENFIGGHPMAGSEKTGYRNASVHLMENAFYILTPSLRTPEWAMEKMEAVIGDTGAIPVKMNPNVHDDVTAAISHVPHIIAALLVNMVKDCDDADEKMRSLAAGGFKDITRIASSSPVMWQNICAANSDSISRFLRLLLTRLEAFEHSLSKGKEEFLLEIFNSAKDYRDSIPNKNNGIMGKIHEVFIDLIDEAGAIATVATILASNGVSIKNIGILHNREFQDGVLRIELYDQASANKASSLLKHHRYTIYER